jgi:hypothetical protein
MCIMAKKFTRSMYSSRKSAIKKLTIEGFSKSIFSIPNVPGDKDFSWRTGFDPKLHPGIS